MHNKSHVSKGTVGYHCNHKLDENPISISHGTRTAIHTNSTQTNRHHSTMNFHEHPSHTYLASRMDADRHPFLSSDCFSGQMQRQLELPGEVDGSEAMGEQVDGGPPIVQEL